MYRTETQSIFAYIARTLEMNKRTPHTTRLNALRFGAGVHVAHLDSRRRARKTAPLRGGASRRIAAEGTDIAFRIPRWFERKVNSLR